MPTIPQNAELLKHLFSLLNIHRSVVKQQRVYERLVALCLGQVMGFARRTITQLLFTLGMNETDWSSWYRLFSAGRFDYERASEIFFGETLRHVGEDEVYVVGGDATQTPRSSHKMEGSGWLRNLRTPPTVHGGHSCRAALVQRQLADASREWLQSCLALALVGLFHAEEPTARA